MSPTSVLIALILCGLLLQYALGWRQARRFAAQLGQLRAGEEKKGVVSVGVGRHRGRRVYVALAADPSKGVVTSALSLSGATVFASARPWAELVGTRVRDLADGEVPTTHSLAVIRATKQAANFALEQISPASATV